MSRKVTGVVVALLLAAIGTTVLVRYVQGAEDRALEGEQLVQVFVVDDDRSMRVAVERLLRSSGLEVESFSSARTFLEREPAEVAC